MVSEQVLDGMTREQLISLLYSILRRLLLTPQTMAAPTDRAPAGQEADGGLVIDPTIDAWEHTGVYPQGFQPTTQRGYGSIDNLHTRPTPQFGGQLRTPGTYSHTPAEMIIASPPCTAFSRPWQPGYPMPVLPSPSVGGVSSRDEDDPWAAPAELPVLTVDQVPQSDTVTLPLNSLLMLDNRPICAQRCRCSAQCVAYKAGHTRHLCGACIYRRRGGDPRSGS